MGLNIGPAGEGNTPKNNREPLAEAEVRGVLMDAARRESTWRVSCAASGCSQKRRFGRLPLFSATRGA